MALILADRVRDSSTTTGTGALTLAGTPPTGYRTFGSVMADADTCWYAIVDTAGNWEVGLGTYTATGTLLNRTTVLSSSNANALVSFPAGTKDVFLTQPAAKSTQAGIYVGTTAPADTSLIWIDVS